MSIETTLTWGVALALIVATLVIRTLALGIYRLVLFAWVRLGGTAPVGRGPDVREALPRIPLRERLSDFGDAAAAAAVFVAANLARGIELLGRGLGWTLERTARASEAAWTWSSPRTRSAWSWTSPRLAGGARATGGALRAAWIWVAASVATFVRNLRSPSYPGARPAPVAVRRTEPSARVAAARLARARSNTGTRAGAA